MRDDHALMAKVADLYYTRDLTQQAIASRLGVSRPTVSRLLERARAVGIVRIEITAPSDTHAALERGLEETFGLREAIVAAGHSESPGATRRALAQAAAAYLDRVVKARARIGVSWGTTLSAVLDVVRPRRLRVEVVPLVGGVGRADPEIHANDLARRLAGLYHGRVTLLHAPAIVAQPSVRDALLSDPRIREVLTLARKVDLALVGIGALVPSSTLVQSRFFTADDLAALRGRGAVGDICTRAFDAAGQPVDHALDARILAVDLEALRRIPTVVAVAGGFEKADAIAGALRGGLVDVLVTDHFAARAVLRGIKAGQELNR